MNKQIKTIDYTENHHELNGIFCIIDGGIIPASSRLGKNEPMISPKGGKLYAITEKQLSTYRNM